MKHPENNSQGRGFVFVILVTQEQLKEVEYLIQQSLQGHHVLFDPDTIRRAFKKHLDSQLTDSLQETVNQHIENLFLQPTLLQKKRYLDTLKPEIFDFVLRGYFPLVANTLNENSEIKH